jgi:Aldo/keto reductase family
MGRCGRLYFCPLLLAAVISAICARAVLAGQRSGRLDPDCALKCSTTNPTGELRRVKQHTRGQGVTVKPGRRRPLRILLLVAGLSPQDPILVPPLLDPRDEGWAGQSNLSAQIYEVLCCKPTLADELNQKISAIAGIQEIAKQDATPITTLSIAWLMANPAVTSVILGASRAEQLTDTLAAADYSLDRSLKAELDQASIEFLRGDATSFGNP